MKPIQHWLDEYGESHQNETNELIHWICVPSIFLSLVAMFYSIKLPAHLGNYQLNVGVIVLLLVLIYYFRFSLGLGTGMLLFGLLCVGICEALEATGILPLWAFGLIIFVFAWIGQFYGHKIEGKKPSFLKDIQFLLIGPAWLMSFVFKKLGIPI